MVYTVRLCDGGHPESRARVKLNLGGSIRDIQRVPGLESLLSRELTLDLFDPPQRERIRTEAVRLAAEGLTERCIARSLSEKVTQPAVQSAARRLREAPSAHAREVQVFNARGVRKTRALISAGF
jgi:site-specific DNA recombinase